MSVDDKTARIRNQNDLLRATGAGGKIVFVGPLAQESEAFRHAVFERVRLYRDFTKAKDPYAEHDYGRLKVRGKAIAWKINYYDTSLQSASPDPADPKQTTRLLSIFFAEDN